jgi:hypothetical protein
MAVGDILKLVIHLRHGDSTYTPGLHFQVAEGAQNQATLIASWRGAVESAMLNAMSGSVALVSYDAVDVKPGLLATRREELSPPLNGFITGDMAPPQDCVLFTFQTAAKSRRARGRVYWPGLAESHQIAGLLEAGGSAAWTALITSITANYLGTTPISGFRLVNFSPERLTAPPPPPTFKPRPGDVITSVTNIVLDTVVRSQRRRQVGVGS